MQPAAAVAVAEGRVQFIRRRVEPSRVNVQHRLTQIHTHWQSVVLFACSGQNHLFTGSKVEARKCKSTCCELLVVLSAELQSEGDPSERIQPHSKAAKEAR